MTTQQAVALINRQVDRFLANRPELEYLRDEFRGAGYLTYAKLRNKLPSIKNPTMYLIVAVANACKDVAKHYSAKTVQLPEELLDDKGLATSQDLQPFLELCENDTERAIVRLKAEDFETKQIARTLQISRQTVERILRTLYARYLAS